MNGQINKVALIELLNDAESSEKEQVREVAKILRNALNQPYNNDAEILYSAFVPYYTIS